LLADFDINASGITKTHAANAKNAFELCLGDFYYALAVN
jgi:hypothetical protein